MMPTWITIALTIFYVLWLCAALLLWCAIWRNGVKRGQAIDQTLIDAVIKSTEAAKTTAEAARLLADHMTRNYPSI